jgi:serine protease Do
MNDIHPNNQDPCYRTGSTTPPKSRRGLLAVLLVIVILLCGIVTALSFLNIRLFQKIQQDSPDTSFRFSAQQEADQNLPKTTIPNTDTQDPQITMELSKTPASVENVPQEGGLSLQSIYEKAIPSVVSISCSASTGTGVILSADGYIVTNCHVVENATSVEVIFEDGSKHPARIVGTDTISDLAVLHTDRTGLTPAEFGDSSALRVGDSVVAIGDPLGIELRGTMTDGIVSAINRDIATEGRTMTLIQTNAALNSGNSGGPLLNCYGQVVGINTMKIGDYMSSAGVEGLGFAIPSATVKEIVEQLVTQGYVSGRPTLGIKGEALSSFYQYYYRLPAGVYITHVEQGSDAHRVGIEEGDLLISIGGTRVVSYDEMRSAILAYEVGDTVDVIVYRDGQQYRVAVTLSEDKG